ncbi:MAG TPA: hypothetical protein VK932_13145 [Kofleriaceae bacterium]|nr:hypothetical protein [Kofleriaceae bacterium]
MVKKLASSVVFLAVLVLTPYFLFASPADFTFGEREVRAAVEGRWTLKLPERELELAVELARKPARASRDGAWIRPAAACKHRTLVRSAEACLDTTKVELLVKVAGAAPARGELLVIGKSFRLAKLRFEVGGQPVYARLSSAGEATQVQVGNVPATLVRRR